MNYGQFKTLVARNLGNRGTELSSPVDLLSTWINGTYLDLLTRAKFPELGRMSPIPAPACEITATPWNTADGTATHAVPTDMIFPISIRNETSGWALVPKTIQWYDRHKMATTGKPMNYIWFGDDFYLHPTPDDVYSIQVRYRKRINDAALVADTDELLISEEFQPAIEFGATWRGAISLAYSDADAWLSRFTQFLQGHSM